MNRFVLRLLANLRKPRRQPSAVRQARPRLEGMEERLAPTVAVGLVLPPSPAVIRGFNPQPEPPGHVLIQQAPVNPVAVDLVFTAGVQVAR